MPSVDVSKLLRPGLLSGTTVLVAGASLADGQATFGAATLTACGELQAQTLECELEADGTLLTQEQALSQAVEGSLVGTIDVDLLALDAASVFERARSRPEGEGSARTGLAACLDLSWGVTRAVAERAFLAKRRGGRIVLVGPSVDAGEHAGAAVAGLENLARTLSIEWARHRVTAVAIAPGNRSAAARASEVGALMAYLASPAGAYFSGCLLDLRGANAAA